MCLREKRFLYIVLICQFHINRTKICDVIQMCDVTSMYDVMTFNYSDYQVLQKKLSRIIILQKN